MKNAAIRRRDGGPRPNSSLEGEGLKRGLFASPLMPGARVREDGWTAVRVTKFLAVLAETGCVTDAARVVGISRTSVNRARERYAPFDKACRAALAQSLRGLEAVAYQRAVAGRETIIIRKGEEVERRIAPSDAMLKLLIQRGDMSGLGPLGAGGGAGEGAGLVPTDSRGRPLGPEGYITLEDHEDGWSWVDGVKSQEAKGAKAALIAKFAEMGKRMDEIERERGECRRCHQPMSDAVWDEIVRRGRGCDPYATD